MPIHINEHNLNPKPRSEMRVTWLCLVYSHSCDDGSFRWFHYVLKALKEDQSPTLLPSSKIKTFITSLLVLHLLKFPKEPPQ
jgi:hypothetical protein